MLQKVQSKPKIRSCIAHTDMKKYSFLIPESRKRGNSWFVVDLLSIHLSLLFVLFGQLFHCFTLFYCLCTLQTLHSNTSHTASILVAFSTWKPYKFRIRKTGLLLSERSPVFQKTGPNQNQIVVILDNALCS